MGLRARYCILSAALFLAATAHCAQAASLYLSPDNITAQAGSSFSVGLYVSSLDQPMNAAGLTLRFPTDLLQVTGVTKNNSIFNLWVQEPSYSNKDGTVNFEGIVLNPGFTGAAGRMLTVNFRIRNVGSGKVRISEGQVLANDGDGTSITGSLGSATVSALPAAVSAVPADAPVIRSTTHPSPDTWYRLQDAKFVWEHAADFEGAAWAIGPADAVPPTSSFEQGAKEADVALTRFPDGTHYFLLRTRKNGQWSATGRYKFNVDRTAPRNFQVTVRQDDPTDPQPQISFIGQDETSGISGYQIKVDSADWIDSESLRFGSDYRLAVLPPGPHAITVRAVDRAGNYTDAQTAVDVAPIQSPVITEITPILNSVQGVLKLRGEAPTGTVVELSGVSEARTVLFAARTDTNGQFSYESKGLPIAGKWIFTAIAKDSRGATSNPSAPVSVEVRESVVEFLKRVVQWWGALLLLLILLLIATFITRWAFVRGKLAILKQKQEILDRQRDILRKLETLSVEARESVLNEIAGSGEKRKTAISQQIEDIQLETRQLEKDLKREYREEATSMERIPEKQIEQINKTDAPAASISSDQSSKNSSS
jgi:hypothetical protein